MRELTIYRLFFTNADCYKKGVIQTPKGVQVHSTGATNPYLHRYVGPDDGRLGPNQYNNTHNRPGGSVCASAYIGRLNDRTPAIYQALPWNMKCWLSANGPNGNANNMGFIGFEICEDNRRNREYFEQVVMTLSVNLCAYLCQEFNIPVEKVLDHSELHKLGIGSDHGDITWWLVNFGYNMDMYRNEVRKALAEGVHVTYIDAFDETPKEQEVPTGTMYNAKVVAKTGNTVNFRATINGKILNTIKIGSIVQVISQPNQWWSEVKYNNKVGYMMSEFLEPIQNSTVEPAQAPTTNDDLIKLKTKLEEALAIVNKLLE